MRQIIISILMISSIGLAQEFHSPSLKTTARIYALQDSILTSIVDWSSGNTKIKYLTENTVLNMINTVNGAQITIVVMNSSSYTLAWTCSEAPIMWISGITPIQSTSGKTDIYSFIRAGGKIYGTVIQNY
jgi:hypothetical protein